MGIQSDLKLGEEYQQKYLDLIEYDTAEMAQGCFKPYDIKVTHEGCDLFFEVKCDRISHRTGNMVIEHKCSGKPSGISTTTADYWVYFPIGLPYCLLIPVKVIREKIEQKKYLCNRRGGDGFRSEMYLFSMEVFSDYKFDIPYTSSTV